MFSLPIGCVGGRKRASTCFRGFASSAGSGLGMNNLIRSRGRNGLLAGPEAFSRGRGGPPSHHFLSRVPMASGLSDGGRRTPPARQKPGKKNLIRFPLVGWIPNLTTGSTSPVSAEDQRCRRRLRSRRAMAVHARDRESKTEKRGERWDAG